MEFGVQMIFQSFGYGPEMTDAKVYDEEIRLAILADELGYDHLWPVEHHFEDYSFCPDNTVFLAHIAARTKRIKLGTGAVIIPWNDPLRVAEKMALLDLLSGGRALFGMGRGLARREYAPFKIDMDTSRARFDEAAPMILNALETGVMEGNGKFYPQPRTEIRPRPGKSFKGRTYCVSMSPDSANMAGQLGVRQTMFTQGEWEASKAMVDVYRESYRKHHGATPPPSLTCDFIFCSEDEAEAREDAAKYLTGYIASLMGHYELAGEHFKNAKGYESYGAAVDILRQAGLEDMTQGYLKGQIWGTPEQCIEKINARRAIIGDFDLNCCFRFAGMPFEVAERSMRLFGSKVIPAIHAQDKVKAAE